jgi:hypothetical protein
MMLHRRRHAWVVAPLAALVAVALASTPVESSTDVVPGSQGTDTALPATASLVTVRGRGAFADLAVTVNQTANLTNQAVSITWTGATPTRQGPGRFGAHFLQVMQCWGDDDGAVAANPGPPPEQCVQGASAGTYGGLPDAPLPGGFASSRIISRSGWGNFDSAVGVLDPRTTNVWRPFRAVGGTAVNVQTDPTFNPSVRGGNFWLNPYFNIITTNEIAAAATGPDGRGAELFEVQTGLQSSGLGCGQKVQPTGGGATKVPQCWIVIVPRGEPSAENVGTPFAEAADQNGVVTSPLSPAVWQNRIAIPIGFTPVDSPCRFGADERRVAGSELVLAAFSRWQPALCAGTSLPPYSYAPVSDAAARQQLAQSVAGGPGMVVVSRPLSSTAQDPGSPVVYAPLSVSGVVIGFNIERNPRFDAPAAAQSLSGVRVAQMNLTPRLVAKLLTQSYTSQLTIAGSNPGYTWSTANPNHLGLDPDFLRFNPEFTQLQFQDSRTFGGLQLPSGTSDAAQQVWEWVLADPEASAWLAGTPDEWGMKVNPAYSTSAATNPTGVAFGQPVPASFPKADSYCYQAPARGQSPPISPPPLCGTDWMPYSRGFADSARITRIAYDAARIADNPFASSASEVWKRDVPQYLGRRGILSITDTPSAAQFGVQMARLSRAGDSGTTRTFVAPDAAGLAAGAAAMSSGSDPAVLEPVPTAAAGAYPLTTLTYAAVKPLSLDEAARSQYASLLDYVAGPGQVSGPDLGQLPNGYLPLPESLRAVTVAAAASVRTLAPPPSSTTTTPGTTVPDTAAPSTAAPVATTPQFGTTYRPVTTARPSTATTTATTLPAAESSTTVEAAESGPTSTEPAPATTVADAAQAGPVPVVQRPVTPTVEPSKARYAMAGMGALSILSAWGALEITKRARRSSDLGSGLESFGGTGGS